MPRLTRAESMQRTRAALLTAAEEIFAERGFAEASLESIAERAGHTRGAVYAAFGNKTDLFLALLEDWLGREIEDSATIIDPADTAEQHVDALRGHGGNRFADRRRFLLLAEFRLYALRNPDTAAAIRAYDRRSLEWFTSAVEGVLDRADIKAPDDPHRIGLMTLALEHGIATLSHADPESVPPDAYLDCLSLLTRSLFALAREQHPPPPMTPADNAIQAFSEESARRPNVPADRPGAPRVDLTTEGTGPDRGAGRVGHQGRDRA